MTLVNCFGDCGPDYECNMQCFDEASPDATMKLEAFNSCLMQECPDGEPGCIEDAQMGICAEPVMMCMDDDSNCSCDGKECGTDGCGQDCGVCGPDWWCDFGKGVCKQEQIPCDDNSDCPDGMICNEEGLCFMVSDCDPACEPGMSCLDGVCIDG